MICTRLSLTFVLAGMLVGATGPGASRGMLAPQPGVDARPRLTFTIALPRAQFALGEVILLTMILLNTSDRLLVVNKRLAVYDQEAPELDREVFLRIKLPSGQEAPFGWGVRRALLGTEDFTRLRPGERVDTTVDIADLFFLEQRGLYEVRAVYRNTFRGPLAFDRSRGELVERDIGAVRTRIRSNRLSFRIQ